MRPSAEALGPKGAAELLASGADEILIPCLGGLDEAIAKAARVPGPVAVHTPVNRIDDPAAIARKLHRHGIGRVLVISGNPAQGRGTHGLTKVIRRFRDHGLHVSVGAYPESYFGHASAAHHRKSAGELIAKQAAGAQRIITQASFNAGNMSAWLLAIRRHGVTLPVHVSVMARIPRRVLGRIMRQACTGMLSRPWTTTNRANLDLLYRVLRSGSPMADPTGFLRAVGRSGAMRAEDRFHLFSYGADIRGLIAAGNTPGVPDSPAVWTPVTPDAR